MSDINFRLRDLASAKLRIRYQLFECRDTGWEKIRTWKTTLKLIDPAAHVPPPYVEIIKVDGRSRNRSEKELEAVREGQRNRRAKGAGRPRTYTDEQRKELNRQRSRDYTIKKREQREFARQLNSSTTN